MPYSMSAKRGFTLIEMLVVIVIIGVLAAVVAPRLFGKTDEARVAAAKVQIENFSTALEMYAESAGGFPTTAQGLEALVAKPSSPPVPRNWSKTLNRDEIPKDPWGNPYQYLAPGKHNPDAFDLFSYGKDGKTGGTGLDADITNW